MSAPAASRRPSWLVWLLACAPALWLAGRALGSDLGANPIETVTHTTGTAALWLLLGTLAVTPARRWLRAPRLAPLRRPLGLASFAYAALHLLVWIVFEHDFAWGSAVEDVLERPYVLAGMTAFACLVPLALTSTRGAMRRLGRRWVTLHRLVYLAAAAAVVHHLWLVKADLAAPLAEAAILALLLGARAPRWAGRV